MKKMLYLGLVVGGLFLGMQQVHAKAQGATSQPAPTPPVEQPDEGGGYVEPPPPPPKRGTGGGK